MFCVGVSLLISCEEPIENPFGYVEPRLVMTSTFAPGQMVEVRLSASQPITGETRFLEIKDADVRIYAGQEMLEKLTYHPGNGTKPGFYKTTHLQPVVGRSYTLLAQANGFTPISAESSIPTSVPIKSLRVDNLTRQSRGDYITYDFLLHVDYEDPPEEGNFYDLRISQRVIPFRINSEGDTTFHAVVTKGLQAPDAPVDLSNQVAEASVLIKDKPLETGLVVRLQTHIFPQKEVLGDLVAELRTVSEPYFQFQRAIQDVGAVYGGISESRVNNYTNVSEGYGLFAGYNSATGTIRISSH